MTPEEIYKKKAEAVTKADKLSAADHLEAAAKLLRAEAGQSKELVGIAAIKAAKLAGRQRGAAMFSAIGKAKQDAFNAALADGGWKLQQKFESVGMEHYIIPSNPAYKMVVSKGKFRVYVGGEVTKDWTDTKHLQDWVDSKKKKK
jgi:hypothetical protein